jgi:AmmeMemoRadiSam system protein A
MDTDYYTTGEREFLLKIARKSLSENLLGGDKFEPQTVNRKMWEKHGVFVSIIRDGEASGCIGSLRPSESLILSVRDNVIKASVDSRSEPLSFGDLEDIEIEISILSELKSVKLSEIKVGDGILIELFDKSATYLPAVWDSLKNKDEFLASLCKKAGLEEGSYKDDEALFWTYEAITFKE